jgi:ribosomal protein L27
MAKGFKLSKNNTRGSTQGSSDIQIDQAIGPQTIAFHSVNNTTVVTAYVGGTGGTTVGTTSRTIQVHFKDAAGNAYSDGFIVRQRGRKQFLVQSVGTGVSSLTRCTLVESGTLAAKQAYITFGYQGGGTQYAFRISDRFVWTNGSAPVRYRYVLGASAAVAYHQGTADTYFKNSAGGDEGLFAVVEGA